MSGCQIQPLSGVARLLGDTVRPIRIVIASTFVISPYNTRTLASMQISRSRDT